MAAARALVLTVVITLAVVVQVAMFPYLSIAGVVLRLCDAGRSDPSVIDTLVELNRTFSGGMAGRAERQDAA